MSAKGVIRPWSELEDESLSRGVAKYGEIEQWKTIAAEFVPGRTNKACRKRWLHSLSPTVKKTPWTTEEDQILMTMHAIHGERWAVIARAIPGRTDDACSKRFRESLDPTLRKDAWTPDEDQQLVDLYAVLQGKWSRIGQQLGRSGLGCRNRWRLLERRRLATARTHEQHDFAQPLEQAVSMAEPITTGIPWLDDLPWVTAPHAGAIMGDSLIGGGMTVDNSFMMDDSMSMDDGMMYPDEQIDDSHYLVQQDFGTMFAGPSTSHYYGGGMSSSTRSSPPLMPLRLELEEHARLGSHTPVLVSFTDTFDPGAAGAMTDDTRNEDPFELHTTGSLGEFMQDSSQTSKRTKSRTIGESENKAHRLSSTRAVTTDPSILPYACGATGCWDPIQHSSKSCFATSQDLSMHCRESEGHDLSGEKIFRCALPRCGKAWKSVNGLQYHLQVSKAHYQVAISKASCAAKDAASEVAEPIKSGKKHPCPHPGCPNSYKQLSGLRYHLQHGHPPALPQQLDMIPPSLATKLQLPSE